MHRVDYIIQNSPFCVKDKSQVTPENFFCIKAKRNCRVAVKTDGNPTTLGARVHYDKVIEQTTSANLSVKVNKNTIVGL